MNPLDIIAKYYPVGSEAYRILVIHSRSVADKALAIARMHPEMNLDLTFVEEAAMLHDIGIFRCNAPDIDCHGDAEYICHTSTMNNQNPVRLRTYRIIFGNNI